MSKTLTLVILVITLSGCVPLPISLGVSGWSYLISGKSPTDHLISQTINQDCKILRLAVGKEPCAEFTNGERSLVWAVFRADHERSVANSGAPKLNVAPDNISSEGNSPPSISKLAVSAPLLRAGLIGKPKPTALNKRQFEVENLEGVLHTEDSLEPSIIRSGELPNLDVRDVAVPKPRPTNVTKYKANGNYALVLGSVAELKRASVLSSRFSDHQASIVSVEVNGRTWHRVVVGPAPLDKVQRLKALLGRIDGKKPWIFDTKQA